MNDLQQDLPHSLTLPGTFVADHLDRCSDGTFVLARGRRWTVRMNDAALSNLASDARYYADRYGPDGDNALGLRASAKRTVAAPDLLAACERALTWLSSYPGGGAIGAYDEMRAAIAKAVSP